MTRIFLSICAAVVALAPATDPSARPLAASTKTILVSVTATADAPVQALSAADFTIEEQDAPVEITAVFSASQPMSVVLLLDTTYALGRNAPTQDVRRAASAFVSTLRAAAPDTQVALYSVSNAAIPLTDFTADPVRIADAIAHIVVGAQSASPMLEGVIQASQSLEHRPAPRRAIVAVSLGSAEAGREHPTTIVQELQASGATLWTVSVAGSGDIAPASVRDEVWNKMTRASGGIGVQVVQATGLENQLTMIANTLLSQYLVTFARNESGPLGGLTGRTSKGAKVLFSHWVR
jgi:hypothetical protein